jgi:glycosyltransferase involved in cell wall biosynthesis
MPTYNWSSVLPYSIGSALRQTFVDFELLVVGDGCTDDSESVVAAIGDPRVRWINLPVNTRHQSGPNNEGLRQARGEIVAYLGHDDLWMPHHLASLVAALDGALDGGNASGGDVAHAIIAFVGPAGKNITPARLTQRVAWMPPTGIAHRRTVTERIGGWRDYRELAVPPESDLLARAKADGFRFVFAPRLTAIKLPAGMRRDVYKTRPCHEQAAWLARIDSEPELEAVLLAQWVSDSEWAFRVPYSELTRRFASQTWTRVKRRFTHKSEWIGLLFRRKAAAIDRLRRYKGL